MRKTRYHGDPATLFERIQQIQRVQSATGYQQRVSAMGGFEHIDTEFEKAILRYTVDVFDPLHSEAADYQYFKSLFVEKSLKSAIHLFVVRRGDGQPFAPDAA